MMSLRSSAHRSVTLRGTIFPLLLLLLRIEPFESFLLLQPQHHSVSPSHRPLLLSAKPPSSASSTANPPRKRQYKRTKNSSNANTVDHRQIASLGRRGQTDRALALFHSIPPSTVTIRQLNAALDACARSRPSPRIDTAFALLHDATAVQPPNVYTFGALLNALRRAGDIDRALSVLASMQAAPYHVAPNAVIYQSVIATAAAAADVTTAWRILYESQDHVTIIAYNAALSAAARAGNAEKAMDIWEFLQQRTTDDLQPDAVTYGTVLAACEAARDWERVLEFAQEHTDALDDQGLATAIHACQQLGRAEGALEFLQRTRRVDIVAYRLAISACARGGAWREGIELLEKVPVNDTMAFTAAITGCEYAGEWKEACRLLSRMRKNGCPFNCVTMAAVIGACATACSQQIDNLDEGNLDDTPKRKALQLLMAMRKDETVIDPNINVYNAAIRACAESRDIKSAFSLLDLAEKDQVAPTVVTFGTLMTACERVASVKGVGRVLRMMKERDIKPNEIVFGAAISCCRKAGEAMHAFRLLELMQQDESLRPNAATLNTVMLAQTENITSSDTAPALMARARTIFDNMSRPGRQSYEILIRGYCAARRPGDAHRFLLRMANDLGHTPPPDVNLYTLTVAAYERNGKPREALRVMESMRESGYDFYPSTMLNTAFKRLVKLTNAALGGP